MSVVSPLRRLIWLVLCAAWCIAAKLPAAAAEEFVFYHENVMGTSLELAVAADNLEAARWAEARALAEIDRLSSIFNGYDDESEFSRWQHVALGTPVSVSRELFEVLAACDQWGERSSRAFDPRVERLTRLWARLRKDGPRPSAAELGAAKALMSPPAWKLDPAAQHGRAPIGLPAQPQRDRQGLHRRAGLRGRT